MKLYKVLKVLLSGFFTFIYRLHPHGAENVPEEGGCLIAPNHLTALDPILIGVSSKRPVIFMAKAELFKIPIFGAFIKALGAFPVSRGEGDVSAVKKSISIINRGDPLSVFPQGTRCPETELSETRAKLKSGVGLIAHKTGVPIVPVYIKTKKNRIRLFRRTDIYFGKPIYAEQYMVFEGKEKYSGIVEMTFDKILELEAENREVSK